MKIAVIIPCYNESKTIGKVVSDFRLAIPEAFVYVYDNNSTDNSAQLAGGTGAIVISEHRQGKGFVMRSMFRDVDADYYIMVDGDDTYPVDEALKLLHYAIEGQADMVIGDRLSSTYFSENKRLFHGVGNRLVRLLVNKIFHSNIKDIMTGCRCFSRQFVKSFPVLSGGFEIETEMTIHALDKNFVICELPIEYRDRVSGSESKLNTFSDGFRVIMTIIMLFKDYRPLQFFSIVSLFLFTVSICMFMAPLGEYISTGYVLRFPTLIVSIGMGTCSLLSLVCGVILDSIRNHSRQFYELSLTFMREIENVRRAHDL